MLSANFYRYGIALFFITALLVSAAINIHKQSKTSDVHIEVQNNTLQCSPDINILDIKNITAFYEDRSDYKSTNLEVLICSFDEAFDGSKTDRSYLFGFTQTKLTFWTVNRPDIAEYFYTKIIKANPNDTLSFYIKNELINYI